MDKKEKLKNNLDEKASLMLRFIKEVLINRDETNKEKLNELEDILFKYFETQDINILHDLQKIESRPVPEGVETDYTTGISLPIDGKYTSLMELINDIEDLVFKISEI
jgi:hypothetical protein